MTRRHFLEKSAALTSAITGLAGTSKLLGAESGAQLTGKAGEGTISKLDPPAHGQIPVAFAITQDVTLIDFAGPWEVFNNVMLPEPGNDSGVRMPFDLFTVSDSTKTIRSGSLQIVPNFTFENLPRPKIVVIPAQRGSKALHSWLRDVSKTAEITMSVCTGAFQLARAGLLSGKPATTHHAFTDRLEKEFPDIVLKRGVRFVENDKISTAGGLSAGDRSRPSCRRTLLRA
jgi:transcriptional regulator GlxA family with amidase domain